MIENQRGIYTPICDGCGSELPDEYDFQDAVNAMKLAGWRAVPPDEAGGE